MPDEIANLSPIDGDVETDPTVVRLLRMLYVSEFYSAETFALMLETYEGLTEQQRRRLEACRRLELGQAALGILEAQGREAAVQRRRQQSRQVRRQGDAGSSKFFLSLQDDLMRIFGGERIASIMDRLKVDDETPIENKIISKSLEGAQKKVEGYHFDQRKNVVQYDDVMNRHRKATYAMRREILKADDISKRIRIFIEEESRIMATSPDVTSDDFEDIVREVFPFDEPTLDRLFDSDASKFEKVLEIVVFVV